MSSWAKPGVKCVCVRSGGPYLNGAKPSPFHPVVGSVHTITRKRVDEDGTWVCLEGLGFDYGYDVRDFRPLITRTQEQDVALFRHILDRAPAPEDAL